MPVPFVNPFTPQTPIGAGLQNIASALFSGASPVEREAMAAKNALNAAHADYYRAGSEKIRGEIAARQNAERDMAGALDRAAVSFFGNKPNADLFLSGRNTGGTPVRITGPDASMGPMPEPAQIAQAVFDPQAVSRFNRFAAGIEAAKALPGNDNLSHLSKIIEGLYNDEMRTGIVAGTQAPLPVAQAAFALSGKAPFDNMAGTGTFNQLTGAQSLNPLGQAKVDTEKADQAYKRAAAGNQGAQALKHKTEELALRLVPATDAAGNVLINTGDGQPIMVPQGERGKVMMRGSQDRATWGQRDAANAERTDAKVEGDIERARIGAQARVDAAGARYAGGGSGSTTTTSAGLKPIVIKAKEADALDKALTAYAGKKWQSDVDRLDVVDRQAQYYSTPGSEAYGNPSLAAKMAIDDIFGGSFSSEGSWSRAKGERVPTVPPLRLNANSAVTTTTNRTPTGRGAPIPPAGQAGGFVASTPPQQPQAQPKQMGAPASAEDAINQANEAIAKGADPEKVRQRLRQMGINATINGA